MHTERSRHLVQRLTGKFPILGVCLGHQAIGAAFGGKIIRAPKLFHGKTSSVHHDAKGVFRKLSDPFTATRYHSLIIERKSLPRDLTITAETDDGIIMGVRHRRAKLEGVQFHPESVLTTSGKTSSRFNYILRNVLRNSRVMSRTPVMFQIESRR
jgi:anthranilate synthase/aminodeoxychorismate synthase-like glutamine amidotransferase